jgi:hypothetical protein
VVHTDAEADRVWRALRGVLGWRGALLGALPPPAEPEADGGAAGAGHVRLLARAARGVGALAAGRSETSAPRLVLPLLPLLGAAVATVVALVAGGLVTLGQVGGGAGAWLRLLGYLAFLVAPFTGVPVGVALAARRYGTRLDAGGLAVIVMGGLVAGCAVSLALR